MALTLGDNFSYQGAKPLDARLKYDTLAAMKAVADSTMYDGCMAYCVSTDKTYQWKSTNTVDADTGKWREYSSGQTIQVATLPTAGADELGKVYQYIGSTTLTLTHGYFYECVSDGAGTPTYSWANVPTSKGGHDIKNDGSAVTTRDTMNFTDFDIADDSTNEETDIKAHRLTQAEMSEIMSTLPGAPVSLPIMVDKTGTERQIGWYVLSNGTKKPIYSKTFTGTFSSAETIITDSINTANNELVMAYGMLYNSVGGMYQIGYNYIGPYNFASGFIFYGSGLRVDTSGNGTSAWQGQAYVVTAYYTKNSDTPS